MHDPSIGNDFSETKTIELSRISKASIRWIAQMKLFYPSKRDQF